MHDLDRTTLETGFQEFASEFETEFSGYEFGQQEVPLSEIFQEAGVPIQETYESSVERR